MNTARKAALLLAITGAAIGTTAGTACAHDGAFAQAKTAKSPGVVSGNGIQVPVSIPVNAVGNSVNVIGILNPAFGNTGANV
ncbi:chaplin [Streptomyces sp. 7-21]|uniref:chaplin n=1 Tax=Streptomyces sp. 7-21 TaxID=2802283 RepID=UPI00191E915B|nr:chaplin [Streptomyces sp. 7-21]MBL1069127.1 chaplin [Streptomyces sp. 7-21]